MRPLIFLICLSPFLAWNQSYNPFYGSIVASSSYDSISTYMNEFTDLGIKQIGTPALTNTKNWIVSKYQDWGYTDIVEDPFSYSGSSTANVIVTKTGTLYPNTFVIVDAHYDTKNGTGSNDNGSGTCILLEIARVLKDIETEYSIKFVHFSGEEDGLIGSQHYVDNTVIPQNLDIKILLNIDEVGGVNGMANTTIVCERDEFSPTSNNAASATMTTILANCMELYSNLNTEISYAYASDYMPFQANGEIITGLFEKNESPYAHTSMDNLSNLDMTYVFEVGKGAIGATVEYAIAIQDFTKLEEKGLLNAMVYPNPSTGKLEVIAPNMANEIGEFEIRDTKGMFISNGILEFKNGSSEMNLSNFESGTYFIELIFKNSNQTLTIIKE